jgi:hypothetical protein
MDKDDIRLKNLKKWKKGQTGNPKGRPKSNLTEYRKLFAKWLTLPIPDNDKSDILKDLRIPDFLVEDINLQEYFFLTYIRVCYNECKKQDASFYKVKDILQNLMLINEKINLTNTESNITNILFTTKEQKEIEEALMNKIRDKGQKEDE